MQDTDRKAMITTGESILVVDDDLVLLKDMEQLLVREYKVSIAKSGAQALELLRNHVIPDLILLDIAMPGMDGYETLAAIRGIAGCGNLPVIFLTGYGDPENEIRGLELGVNDYIVKSCHRDVILARIRHQLRIRQTDSREEKIPGWILAKLTNTEQMVLAALLRGQGNHEIAESLNYSYGYVKNIISMIFAKLEVKNRKELRKLIEERDS